MKRIAVIGPMAATCFLGGYSGRASVLVSPLAGIAEALGETIWSGRISATQFLTSSNFRGPIADYTEDGTGYLTEIRNNDWAQYGPIEFKDKTAIEFRYAAEAAGSIDIYLDNRANAPVASVDVQATKGSLAWQSVSCALPQTAGGHFVIFRFRSEWSKPFFHLASFELTPASAAAGGEQRVVFAPGSVITGRRNEALLRQAEAAAQSAEVVLLFLGVNRLLSDEGRDRESIDLPLVQHELAERVLAANPRSVVVLNTNCPVAIEAEDAKAPAILCALFGGEQQGYAMADAIFGDYNPGGKLSSTWYRGDNQLPNFHDYNLRHGRTYLYFRGSPLYPFGFGLSYTSFALEKLELASQRFSIGSPLGVRVDVINRGGRAGDEVVQLYVQAAGTDRPEKQLAAFDRVRLEAGEKRTVSFFVPADHIALQFWDEQHQSYAGEPGTVLVMAGRSSAEIELRAEATLE